MGLFKPPTPTPVSPAAVSQVAPEPERPPVFGQQARKPQAAPKAKPYNPTFLGSEVVATSQQIGTKSLLGAA